MYSPLVALIVGEYIAAPICPPCPDPPVYIIKSCAGICRSLRLCSSAALSLLRAEIVVVAGSFHHGGLMYVSMCSVLGCICSGKCLNRFSRFVMNERRSSVSARVIHACIG